MLRKKFMTKFHIINCFKITLPDKDTGKHLKNSSKFKVCYVYL